MSTALLPFRGIVTPGLYFSAGYGLWFARFTDTPTDYGPFAQVWLIHPGGQRLLFVEPEIAGPTVLLFHEPDEAQGARMVWRWADERHLHLTVTATDASELELAITLGTARDTLVANGLHAPS